MAQFFDQFSDYAAGDLIAQNPNYVLSAPGALGTAIINSSGELVFTNGTGWGFGESISYTGLPPSRPIEIFMHGYNHPGRIGLSAFNLTDMNDQAFEGYTFSRVNYDNTEFARIKFGIRTTLVNNFSTQASLSSYVKLLVQITPDPVNPTQATWVRYRYWLASDPMPTTWDLEYLDNSRTPILNNLYPGIHLRSALGSSFRVVSFGVGTDGDSAPQAPLPTGGSSGDLIVQETGNDTLTGTGSVEAIVGISGSLSVQEVSNDTLTGTSNLEIASTLFVQETEKDNFFGISTSEGSSNLFVQEAGEDSLSGSASLEIASTLFVQEAGNDTLTGTSNLEIASTLFVQETGKDTFSATESNSTAFPVYIPANLSSPELWYPGRKPTVPVKLDRTNPLSRNLEAAIFADPQGRPMMIDYARDLIIPVDEVSGGAVIFDGSSRHYPIGLEKLNGVPALSVTARAYTNAANSNNNIISSHDATTGTDTGVSIRFDYNGASSGGDNLFKASMLAANGQASETESNTYTVGVPATVTSRWQSGDPRIPVFVDGKYSEGKYDNINTDTTEVAFVSTQMRLGRGPQTTLDGGIFFVLIHSRKLTDSEIQSLHNNPYQILVPV